MIPLAGADTHADQSSTKCSPSSSQIMPACPRSQIQKFSEYQIRLWAIMHTWALESHGLNILHLLGSFRITAADQCIEVYSRVTRRYGLYVKLGCPREPIPSTPILVFHFYISSVRSSMRIFGDNLGRLWRGLALQPECNNAGKVTLYIGKRDNHAQLIRTTIAQVRECKHVPLNVYPSGEVSQLWKVDRSRRMFMTESNLRKVYFSVIRAVWEFGMNLAECYADRVGRTLSASGEVFFSNWSEPHHLPL